MSCDDGEISPDVAFAEDVTSSSGVLRVTLGGSEVQSTITDLGGGVYNVAVDRKFVKCPGPLKIEQRADGSWTQLKCHKVGPCP